MTYAELGAMLPYAGGNMSTSAAPTATPRLPLYVDLFAVAKPASIAAVTTACLTLGFFPAFHWLSDQAVGGPIPLLWSQIFAIAVTWLITGLNYIGIKKPATSNWCLRSESYFDSYCCRRLFSSTLGSFTNFSTGLPQAAGGFSGFMLALIATLWAYDGWNDLTMVAGEVRRPERSLPIASSAVSLSSASSLWPPTPPSSTSCPPRPSPPASAPPWPLSPLSPVPPVPDS